MLKEGILKQGFSLFSTYYNETRAQADIVVVIDVVVVHIAIVEVSVPRVVRIVLRRRPVVVAKAKTKVYVSHYFILLNF